LDIDQKLQRRHYALSRSAVARHIGHADRRECPPTPVEVGLRRGRGPAGHAIVRAPRAVNGGDRLGLVEITVLLDSEPSDRCLPLWWLVISPESSCENPHTHTVSLRQAADNAAIRDAMRLLTYMFIARNRASRLTT